ncbi:MAG: RHS repeat-associated core domain-containing protein [Armatimonadetes bacterium]|nr:RHS repeat-associated core domain-containing protein [Armatimonadota bacterium]NOG39271.1 RHS repeat-associated core domain-containing protein [Armatimonadota bacterium]
MIATLSRQASTPYFSVGDLRPYGVWGSVRSSSSTGDPKQRYCANLGHIQDDESGLIYMRARYYEPWSGRFVSEDPGRQGANWFAYCQNDPIQRIDYSGKDAFDIAEGVMRILFGNAKRFALYACLGGVVLIMAASMNLVHGGDVSASIIMGSIALMALLTGALILKMSYRDFNDFMKNVVPDLSLTAGLLLLGEAGLNLIGILLGVRTGEEVDASVFGF